MRDATAMCDAMQIAHPQIASDAKKFCFFASDAKTPWLALKSHKECHKVSCEDCAMLAYIGVHFNIELCEMLVLRTLTAVWPAMRLRAMPNPEEEGRGTRSGYEASKGSKGISGL